MSKDKLKTAKNDNSVERFIHAITPEKKQTDARALLALFNRVTQLKPQMWGESIIGYGRYEYRYETGREGEFFMTGFSPRKANFSIYIMPGYQDLSTFLARLGKHKIGKSCLYVKALADIDEAVLEEIIHYGLTYLKANYKTFDD